MTMGNARGFCPDCFANLPIGLPRRWLIVGSPINLGWREQQVIVTRTRFHGDRFSWVLLS